jgi:hypothetical protein
MSHTREITSLSRALSAVGVTVIDAHISRHQRIRIKHERKGTFGNITLSLSPSDTNVQRQRERQIRKELARIGVDAPGDFCWRKI